MAEAASVGNEIEEIDLLIGQVRTESARHESRRATASEKLAVAAERLAAGGGGSPKDLAELAGQLVSIARKAALMEAQIDLLEGKHKASVRLHETILLYGEHIRTLAGMPAGSSGPGDGAEPAGGDGSMAGSVAQMVQSAQEDLRREIARQMHDGPAQSLTNIVLQAQIVQRFVTSDPGRAAQEVEALIAMVQRTLEATKTFIFDVRPMVLDDLGLVPTLRRAARDRGGRAGVKIEFESIGVDRRLPVELESGLFRLLDDALVAHVANKPDRLSLRLDWGEALNVELAGGRTPPVVEAPELPPEGTELPPALAEMVEERRVAYREALEAARIASLARLPERLWREVSGRARTLGITAELLDEGARLRLVVPLPELGSDEGRPTT